jgi:hypothetical protein
MNVHLWPAHLILCKFKIMQDIDSRGWRVTLKYFWASKVMCSNKRHWMVETYEYLKGKYLYAYL